MKIRIFGSGSKGNTALLCDRNGNQLIIDCGIKLKEYSQYLAWRKCVAFVTHCHGDHDKYTNELERFGVEVYGYKNLTSGKPLVIGNAWRILPIAVKHGGCKNFGVLIHNLTEHKNIGWFTDLEEMPNVKPNGIDLLAIECNYDEKTELNVFAHGDSIMTNNHTHLSVEKIEEWLDRYDTPLEEMPKNVLIQHTSNSGLLDIERALEVWQRYGIYNRNENLFIARKDLLFEI